MIQVIEQVQAAHRRVLAQDDERGEVRSVVISRTFGAGVSEVWEACTNPERIARWFLPVTGDLRVGGHYQLEGNARGTIDRCDPPTTFVASWEFGGQVSWIELRLTPQEGDTTIFELVHTVPADDKWGEFGPGAVGPGWDLALVGLAALLTVSEGASVDGRGGISPTWTSTDDGIRCTRLSCDGWHRANLAAGTAEEDAQAAADRTASFWLPSSR